MKIPFFSSKQGTENTPAPIKTVVKKEIKLFNTIENNGYYCHSAEQILNNPEFKPLVDKVSSALGGRRDVFEKYLYPSIVQVALFAQKIPASEVSGGKPSNIFGHHMSEGGLLLHSLETMYFALNDSRLAFFNKGVNPSDRDRHMTAARVACGLAGLLHDIGKLNDPIIVTYKDKKEFVWNCVESIPEFLARVHGMKVEDVYANEDNIKQGTAPTYILKGWKKGRSDKHEIIAPFLMRSFVSKATLKMMSAASEQIVHDFMTAVDWRVLANDYTNARQNIIYDVWSKADATSSEKDRKTLSKAELSPIKSNLEIKKQITNAFQFFVDRAEIAVNKDSEECYVYTHATEVSEMPFVVMVRFDEKALGMWSSVLAKASELFKSDVLQDHVANLDNIKELLTQADYLLKANTADGLYTIKRTVGNEQIEFKAVCFSDYHDVIKHNGQLYLAQKDDLPELKVTFADGIEPVIHSKGNNSKKDLRTDLVSSERKKKDKNEATTQTQDVQLVAAESPASPVKVVAKTGVSEAELDADGGTSLEADVTQVISEADLDSDALDTPEIIPVVTPFVSEKTTDLQENTEKAAAPSGFNSSDSGEENVTSSFLKNLFNTTVQKNNLTPEDLPTPVPDEPDDRPLVLKENQIRNFDRAIYGFKDNQKAVVDAQKPNAIRLKELDNDTFDDEEIFNSEEEKYFNGLKVKVVKAIKHVCEQIKDENTRKIFSVQICKRLRETSFSYIDFVTVDNKFCYAAFSWGDNVKKNAHAVQYLQAFEKAGLFPKNNNSTVEDSAELFYFQHVQMIKAVTNIFKVAGIKPLKIKCKDHPYESLLSENDIVEYIKHKIITLDKDEAFFGCKATGYAHERKGKRISRVVLGECANSYGVSMNHVRNLLSFKQQVTPPYMIADGDELVVAYSKPLKKQEYEAEAEKEEALYDKDASEKASKKKSNKKAKATEEDAKVNSAFIPFN